MKFLFALIPLVILGVIAWFMFDDPRVQDGFFYGFGAAIAVGLAGTLVSTANGILQD